MSLLVCAYGLLIFTIYFIVKVSNYLLNRDVQTLISGFRNNLSHIPGPWYSRFTSLVNHYHRIVGDELQWFHGLHQRYGPLVRPEPYVVATADPGHWEQVHRSRGIFMKIEFPLIVPEKFLFTLTDPHEHRIRRRLLARGLTLDTLRRNWEPAIRAKAELAVRCIKGEATSGVANVSRWWYIMASDVISLLSFGESFDMLQKADLKENDEFLTALQFVGFSMALQWLFPGSVLRLLKLVLPFQTVHDIINASNLVFARGSIAIRNLRAVNSDRPNLFSDMLAEADKAGEGGEKSKLTDATVRSEVAEFLVAGADTTAVMLTYIVWEVLRQPSLRSRLETEVAALPPDFNDTDLLALPLLNGVIAESLRLHSTGSSPASRVVVQDGVTFNGLPIPAGTQVQTFTYAMARDNALFPDGERFDETRFDDEKQMPDLQRRIAANFGSGSRSCVGVALARMELRLATALFFREMRGARLGPGMTDDMMEMRLRCFIYPKGGKCDVTLVDKMVQ
ncbi:cytochrome P450 [Lasiosphaeria ovina]|uniref:Cytochrome P450 n=1 Tax=Lasiosphaeria ovina TaxID=92902 RepID=A0AAE0JU10_9PEZI|nr:cytochrome P450 [Lasiosphaeria ovina]